MSPQRVHDAIEEERLEQAADWFVTLQGRDGSDLPADDLRNWEEWIAEPANHAAFDRFASLWVESGALKRPALPDRAGLAADRFDGSQPVEQWLANNPRTREFRFRWATAAAVAVLAIAGSVYWFSSARPDTYETLRGEHREISLPDGSTVTLGAGSFVSVRYSDRNRVLVLDRGEALFEVARDPSRPFVVQAGKGTITALGTSFNVLRNANRVVVTVTDGKVEVKSGQANVPAQLVRGDQVTYDAKGQSGTVEQADPALVTAWRDGRLRYRREPLQLVVDDVNRYSKRRIAIDPAVAGLEFTGVVFRDQIPEWTDGLRRIFPVEVVETGPDALLIRPRAENGN